MTKDQKEQSGERVPILELIQRINAREDFSPDIKRGFTELLELIQDEITHHRLEARKVGYLRALEDLRIKIAAYDGLDDTNWRTVKKLLDELKDQQG